MTDNYLQDHPCCHSKACDTPGYDFDCFEHCNMFIDKKICSAIKYQEFQKELRGKLNN